MIGTVGLVRTWLAVTVAALVTAAGLLVATSPAAAAVPAQAMYSNYSDCLTQKFTAGTATTTVRVEPVCDRAPNQLWRLEFVRGPNAYRLVNNLWDSRGLWCLSAPNPSNSTVFAELCVTPVPLKQMWTPSSRPDGDNQLQNELSLQCLERLNVAAPTFVYVDNCDHGTRQQGWFWI